MVLKKISTFSIENTLKQIKTPISHILEEINFIPGDMEKIQNQWSYISEHLWDTNMNTTDFWIQVHNFRNSINENPFKELSDFVLSLLVLPF